MDWGQKLARSPWMSLVKAGAAMATTTGPVGSAIGKGLAAGAGELEGQRKEIRSEQDQNAKADHLFQQAQVHLDRYQRMTPYEQSRVEAEKYTWQPGVGIDPETGQQVSGAYRLPTRSGEAPQFMPGMAIQGGRGAKPPALQANIEYLVKAGIAKDPQTAFDMIHKSVNDPATKMRILQAQIKIRQAEGMVGDQAIQQANKDVQDMQRMAVQAGSQGGKTIVRQGTINDGPDKGKRVIEYSDGTREVQ
jgi:hypothetical protein